MSGWSFYISWYSQRQKKIETKHLGTGKDLDFVSNAQTTEGFCSIYYNSGIDLFFAIDLIVFFSIFHQSNLKAKFPKDVVKPNESRGKRLQSNLKAISVIRPTFFHGESKA